MIKHHLISSFLYSFKLSVADSKLILLKLARIEQHQIHQTQLMQRLMEVMQSTDDATNFPADLGVPFTSIKEVNAAEKKLAEDENYNRKLVT